MHQGQLYTYSLPSELTTEIPLHNIMATDGEYFVGVGMPLVIKEWKFAINGKSKEIDEMQRIVSSMSEEDNPCLLFYKLRDK